MIAEGQVWRDNDRKFRPARFIRIDTIERRGLWRIARISSRQGDAPWRPTTRFIRLERIPKRFTLQEG